MTPLLHRARRKLSKLIEPNYHHPSYYAEQDKKYYNYAVGLGHFPPLELGFIHSAYEHQTTIILLHGTDTTPKDWLAFKTPYFGIASHLMIAIPNNHLIAPYLVSDPVYLQKLRLIIEYERETTLEEALAAQVDNLIEAAREENSKVIVIGLSWGATIAEHITEPVDLLVLAATHPNPITQFANDPTLDEAYLGLKYLDPQHLATDELNEILKFPLSDIHKRVMVMLGTNEDAYKHLKATNLIYTDIFKGGHSLNPDIQPLVTLIQEIADA